MITPRCLPSKPSCCQQLPAQQKNSAGRPLTYGRPLYVARHGQGCRSQRDGSRFALGIGGCEARRKFRRFGLTPSSATIGHLEKPYFSARKNQNLVDFVSTRITQKIFFEVPYCKPLKLMVGK